MVSHHRTWFSETKYIKFLCFQKYMDEKNYCHLYFPFDTCTVLPEVFIKMCMFFFLIYKSCNLLNHAWDLAQKIKISNNSAAFLTTSPCRTKECLIINSILNNNNICYIIFYLVRQWKFHISSTTHIYVYLYIYIYVCYGLRPFVLYVISFCLFCFLFCFVFSYPLRYRLPWILLAIVAVIHH